MNRVKTWQAVVFAVAAVAIAVTVIWRNTAGQKPPPIPEVFAGAPMAGAGGPAGSPVPPAGVPGAPPTGAGQTR